MRHRSRRNTEKDSYHTGNEGSQYSSRYRCKADNLQTSQNPKTMDRHNIKKESGLF